MHLLHSVITLFILLSLFHRSSVSACCYLSTASTSHTFQLYQTACQAYAYLTHFSPTFLPISAHRHPLYQCSPFLLAFSLATLSLTQDLTSLSNVLSNSQYSFHSVNFPTHSKNHILDLVITSAGSSLAPSLSTSLCSPSDHFPVFTKLYLLQPTLY